MLAWHETPTDVLTLPVKAERNKEQSRQPAVVSKKRSYKKSSDRLEGKNRMAKKQGRNVFPNDYWYSPCTRDSTAVVETRQRGNCTDKLLRRVIGVLPLTTVPTLRRTLGSLRGGEAKTRRAGRRGGEHSNRPEESPTLVIVINIGRGPEPTSTADDACLGTTRPRAREIGSFCEQQSRAPVCTLVCAGDTATEFLGKCEIRSTPDKETHFTQRKVKSILRVSWTFCGPRDFSVARTKRVQPFRL